jgi:hypothetical protein
MQPATSNNTRVAAVLLSLIKTNKAEEISHPPPILCLPTSFAQGYEQAGGSNLNTVINLIHAILLLSPGVRSASIFILVLASVLVMSGSPPDPPSEAPDAQFPRSVPNC